jgi:predicted metal-binding membrane protein
MHEQPSRLLSPSTGALTLAAIGAGIGTVFIAAGMGPGPGSMGLGLIAFLGVWALMMAAMMLPSVSPVALLYLRRLSVEPRAPVRAVRTAALLLGYLLAWIGYGVVAYVLARAGGRLVEDHPAQAPWVAAGCLAIAGLYQLSPWKDLCLRNCRSPVGLFLKYSALRGRARDVEVGLRHGAYCVGCCWGLMLVLLVMGVMNLGWMAIIAAVIAVEKLLRQGRSFGIAVGVGLIALALLVPAHPSLAPGLHPEPVPMDQMDM